MPMPIPIPQLDDESGPNTSASDIFMPDYDGDEHLSGPGEDSNRKKRKRHRAALSCAPCQKRKSKYATGTSQCDRTQPCESCLKRDAAHECVWPVKEKPPERQVFARADELEEVKRKLGHVEQVLARLVKQLPASVPLTSPLVAQAPGASEPTNNQGGPSAENMGLPHSTLGVIAALDKQHHTTGTHENVSPSEAQRDIDSEDAALVLEEIAMGRRRVYGSLRAPPVGPSIPRPVLVGGSLTSCRRIPDKTRYVNSTLFDRDALLNQIWPALPPRHICDELLNIYFEQFDWSWHTHHTPAFRAEVEEFWQLMANGEQNQVDPAWLGVLISTLCVALNTRGTDTPLGTLSGQQLKDQPGVFFELSFTALRAAQWSAKPQVRVVQTCLLWGPFLTHFSGGFSSERAGHMLVWASIAIRIAQLLGLHAMGPESNRLPADDPAWPSGDNSMKREMAKRLWHSLVLLDWTNGARGGTYNIAPDQFTTPLPANVNDEDLGLNVELPTRPVTELTDASFERLKWQLARHQRRIQDRIRKGIYTYERAMEIDRDLRQSINELCGPDIVAGAVSSTSGKPSKEQWLRAAMISSLHNRLCRLHRPFFFHKEAGVAAHSARLGIESARSIVRMHKALIDQPPSFFWSMYVHGLGAALLLSMAALHDIETRAQGERIEAYVRDMVTARDFFNAGGSTHNASVRAVAVQGGQIISSLVDAVQKHKAAFDAGIDPHESLVDIFRRLASRVNTPGPPTIPSSPTLMPINDPTLVEDGLLQAMGLLENLNGQFTGALNTWSAVEDGMGSYLGEGSFGSDPQQIDWSGLLSGAQAHGW